MSHLQAPQISVVSSVFFAQWRHRQTGRLCTYPVPPPVDDQRVRAKLSDDGYDSQPLPDVRLIHAHCARSHLGSHFNYRTLARYAVPFELHITYRKRAIPDRQFEPRASKLGAHDDSPATQVRQPIPVRTLGTVEINVVLGCQSWPRLLPPFSPCCTCQTQSQSKVLCRVSNSLNQA